MHSAACEEFLEGLAEAQDGVVSTEASYVTETIRIEYQAAHISEATLCEALTTTGYTATPRTEATIDSSAITQTERQLDSVLGYRYAVGVLFGAFLMLTYTVLLYPSYLSSLLGENTLGIFAGGTGFGSDSGLLILPLYLLLTGVVLFFTGLPLLQGAYVSLKMRQPTTELLTTLTVVAAFLYSTVAILLGQGTVYYDLTIVVAAVVVAAIFYESLVKQRAMDLLTDLTVSQITEAQVYEDTGAPRTVAVDELTAGDRVLVGEGERVPVDGELIEGECTVDERVVTGESLPVTKHAGDDIVAGSIVIDNAAVVEVGDRTSSLIDTLVQTVWALQSADHGVQRRANRLAARVTPVVLLVALVAGGIHLLWSGAPTTALLVGLATIFVVSPWALGLATPLSVAAGIRDGLQRGIVIFDETMFEQLREVDVVVFDKTGTLTTGEMSVIDADASKELLIAAVRLEQRVSHPVADAIVTAFGDQTGTAPDDADSRTDDSDQVTEFRSHSTGVEGVIGETRVLVGHPDLFDQRGWSLSDDIHRSVADARGFGRIPVVVGRDGTAEGVVVVGDEPREEWDETVTRLSESDRDVVVLTGDDRRAAEFFERHPAVTHVFAEVPPSGKTAAIERLQSEQSVAMVGDGTNDAPALARADLGIALGSGTAIASDAADIAIVDDDLSSVRTAFDLAHAARQRIVRNNGLALVYNLLAVPITLVGLLNPVLVMGAVLSTVALLAANSMRPLLSEQGS